MQYKYMKIFHDGNTTLGIKTYGNGEADGVEEDIYPYEYEILEQGEMINGSAILSPAQLEAGYYPIERFEQITFMADIIPDGEEIKPKSSRHCYRYLGPVTTGEL
jgi:hypothetical protein